MTVTEHLMKPGRFDLKLRSNAPRSVWAAVAEFDHIVITPTRVTPVALLSDSTVLASAIYSGVVLSKPTNKSFSGEGLAWWLGTDDGAGDLLDSAVTNTSATLSTWVTSLRPSSIAAGTVTNTGNTLTYTYQWMSRREALSHACRSVGAEWRINPAGTLDAAASSTLFVSTPEVVITRKSEGPSNGLVGLQATELEQSRDVSTYTQKVIVAGKTGDAALVATGSATGANVYKDFHNNNVVMERLVNAPTEPSANLGAYASAVLSLYSAVRRVVKLSSDTYAVPLSVRPGDWVYVWDQDAYLSDASNSVQWRGELISPIKLRCYSYSWPVSRGMGVYTRRSGATPTYTDLTDWVEWENGDTRWEVGSSYADPAEQVEQLAPAFLGVNADIVARVTEPGRVGVSLTRVGVQSIPTGTSTFTAISWTGEPTDNGGFITTTSDTITVPTGLAGLYDFNGYIVWASSPGVNSTVEILVNSTAWRFPIGAATQVFSSSAFSLPSLAIAVGDTVQVRVSQGSGGAINVTAVMQMWRRGA